MDDMLVRVGLVAGALVVAGLSSWLLRRRAQQPIRSVGKVELDAGLHFFSSTACSSCSSARKKLASAVGADGYIEHVWESEPGVFAQLGVDAVPAVLLVASDGQATLYPGNVRRAVEAL